MASIDVEVAACSASPVDLRIGCSGRNLKFPLDMHSISVGIVVQKRCVRRRPVRLRSAVEGCAVLGVSGGVGGHERALRDHSFPIVSQRFEDETHGSFPERPTETKNEKILGPRATEVGDSRAPCAERRMRPQQSRSQVTKPMHRS